MSQSIKVGDIVHLTEPGKPWVVKYVDMEHKFVRLERVGEAWVRTRVVDIDELHPYCEHDQKLA